ncbi:serine hydrolase domain-containing protein [Plantactinospora sp. GCM10030261]|uniref:serine hydrolase domain-containing protein n=1 Tax=Plantactinospora sp. GCM10030261 TaxID=3273420 RepID=UPI0036063461
MDLQALLAESAERLGVPGAAVAVGAGGELIEAATGVVNRDTGVATTPDSVFQIGSVTKVWTASLVLQLVAEGVVELDAPVRRYLPTFGVLDATASDSVTVRQLLSHTGGFEGDLFEDTGRGDDALGKLITWMRGNAGQVHPPGARHSYCNSGFCVLGAMVAELRGGTWEAVLRERLIEPLGVTHMAMFGEEAVLFRAAAGHVGDRRTVVPRWQMPRSNAPAGSTPCAAPRELVAFGRMFLADGLAADGTRVLPAGTFATMRQPQVTLPAMGGRSAYAWGLGFMLFEWDGVPVVGHDGGTPGQSTCWRIVPDRDVVVAISVNGGDAGPLIDETLAAVLAETAGIRVPARVRPPDTPAEASPDHAGIFEGPIERYEVKLATGGLDITVIPKGFAAEMGDERKTVRVLALGDNRYVAAEPDQGVHPVIAFLENGRYLYTGRAVKRVQAHR